MNVNEDTGPHWMPFTVGDDITPVADLVLSAHSSNPAVITSAGVTFSGTDPLRELYITPLPNAHGAATVTIRVTDAYGHFVEEPIALTVNSINDEPTIPAIAPQTIAEDGAGGPPVHVRRYR